MSDEFHVKLCLSFDVENGNYAREFRRKETIQNDFRVTRFT